MTRGRLELEHRRLEVAADIEAGMRTREIIGKYQVSRMTVSRWRRALGTGGLAALQSHPATGRPGRLTAEQQEEIADLCSTTPPPSAAKVQALIQEKYGVVYDLDHVHRLLHQKFGVPMKKRRAKKVPV